MKIIYDIGSLAPVKKSAVAIGVFDGVHRGHQLLIQQTVCEAKRINGKSVVITFYPHPAHIIRPDLTLSYLISLEHRLALIKSLGVDVCYVVKFNKRFASMLPETFVTQYLKKLFGAQSVFVGDDFRFGRDRMGGVEVFQELGKKYNFTFHGVKRLASGGKVISSTRIRTLITEGKLKKASTLLGRPVSVMGKVVRGEGRGRQLGFPTANIELGNDVWPLNGVYTVRVILGKKIYDAVANVGRRPSFGQDQAINLEVHLLDFNKNIYGKTVTIQFLNKLRDEQSFQTKEALQFQIQQDIVRAQQYFNQHV